MAKRVPKNWLYTGLYGLVWIRIREFKDYVFKMESKFQTEIGDLNKSYNEQIDKHGVDEDALNYIGENYSEQLYNIEKVFLRTFRYSIVVSLYSFLESTMSSLCDALRREKRIDLEICDLRDQGINRNRLFLEKVCKIDFPGATNEWQEIKKFSRVRNCIVHAEGNIHRAKDKSKIKHIIERNSKHLSLENDEYIVVSHEYIEAALNWIEDFLRILHAEAFKKS